MKRILSVLVASGLMWTLVAGGAPASAYPRYAVNWGGGSPVWRPGPGGWTGWPVPGRAPAPVGAGGWRATAGLGPARIQTPALPAPAGDAHDQAQICPAPLSGTFSPEWQGRRIDLQLKLAGPKGSQSLSAMLDTGGVTSTFPDAMLRRLGHQPIAGPIPVLGIGKGPLTGYRYRIPFPAVRIADGWQALGQGDLVVIGLVDSQFAYVATDVLELGNLALATRGSQWTLTLPCA